LSRKNPGVSPNKSFLMNRNLKWIVLGSLAVVAAAALPSLLPSAQKKSAASSTIPPSNQIAGRKPVAPSEPASHPVDSVLTGALSEQDPMRRKELLRQWADSLDATLIGGKLIALDFLSNQNKAEVREALLTSWTVRDPASIARWFGDRSAADTLHQAARDVMAQTLAQTEPAQAVAWMQSAMPESVRREIYGPFFIQWAKQDPAAAGAMLHQLATPASGNKDASNPLWNDLQAQVAAQWADANLNAALSWVKSLPAGPAKTQALVQMSYRWTQSSPHAAAAYTAEQNDPQLLKVVAGKWAESDPQSAAQWAVGLPDGLGRDSAISSLATIWAQKNPKAAADYATRLPAGSAQNQATLAVVSAWAFTAPSQTAQWVGEFPEGPLREQALSQLMSAWAPRGSNDASQWLQNLPQTHSRDVAVSIYSSVISASSPEAAFKWADSISDDAMRNHQLQTIAHAWLEKDPAAAQDSILRSSLPQTLKDQLLSN
jgi:hypothetical protein